jgi:putative transposase
MLKSKKLHSSTKRLMQDLSFYKFKSKLHWLSSSYSRKLYLVSEAFTSRICTNYGSDNKTSKKLYVCNQCGLEIDRDINGARNILLKNTY